MDANAMNKKMIRLPPGGHTTRTGPRIAFAARRRDYKAIEIGPVDREDGEQSIMVTLVGICRADSLHWEFKSKKEATAFTEGHLSPWFET